MRIVLLVDKTGGRYDGQNWAPRGVPMDVPDEEGTELVARGEAQAVKVKKPPQQQAS